LGSRGGGNGVQILRGQAGGRFHMGAPNRCEKGQLAAYETISIKKEVGGGGRDQTVKGEAAGKKL